MSQLPTALWTPPGERVLVLEEVAERVPAVEAEADPVAEGLASLLLDPIAPGLSHGGIVGGGNVRHLRPVPQRRVVLGRSLRAAREAGAFREPRACRYPAPAGERSCAEA